MLSARDLSWTLWTACLFYPSNSDQASILILWFLQILPLNPRHRSAYG